MELVELTELNSYLQKLSEMKNILVCISVKDTAGFCLSEGINKLLMNLGMKTNLVNKHQQSYVGILYGKTSYVERIVKDNISFLDVYVQRMHIQLLSKGFRVGDMSSICIDGKEYSVNERGLNIAVVDVKKRKVLDSVCFDTHTKELKCYRNLDEFNNPKTFVHTDNDYLLGVESRINQLFNEINALKTCFDTLSYQSYMMNLSIINQLSNDGIDPRITLFQKMPPAFGSIRKVQLVELEILKRIDEVCRKNGIKYWSCFGTLLGAIRHKGFIPWDDDIDINVMRDQFELLKAAIAEEDDISLFDHWVFGPTGPHRRLFVHFKGYAEPFVDLFIYDYCPTSAEDIRPHALQLRLDFVSESEDYLRKINVSDGPLSSAVSAELQRICDKYMVCDSEITEGNAASVVWAADNFTTRKRFSSVELKDLEPLKNIEFEGYDIMVPINSEKILSFCYGNYYSLPRDMITHAHLDHGKLDRQCDEICNRYEIQRRDSFN